MNLQLDYFVNALNEQVKKIYNEWTRKSIKIRQILNSTISGTNSINSKMKTRR